MQIYNACGIVYIQYLMTENDLDNVALSIKVTSKILLFLSWLAGNNLVACRENLTF